MQNKERNCTGEIQINNLLKQGPFDPEQSTLNP